MYTLYSITMPQATTAKIAEKESVGQLRKFMNSMKMANKSVLYAIYDANGRMMTSMLNK